VSIGSSSRRCSISWRVRKPRRSATDRCRRRHYRRRLRTSSIGSTSWRNLPWYNQLYLLIHQSIIAHNHPTYMPSDKINQVLRDRKIKSTPPPIQTAKLLTIASSASSINTINKFSSSNSNRQSLKFSKTKQTSAKFSFTTKCLTPPLQLHKNREDDSRK
jgi:hypothetical protein